MEFKKNGFTLAEVLITLVIVGIVAALTIPSVIVNYQKKQAVVKLKKVYSALQQSTNKAIADYGPISTWNYQTTTSKEFSEKYILPYLKVAKNCEYNKEKDCKLYVTGKSNSRDLNGYRFILGDGTMILVRDAEFSTSSTGANHWEYITIVVDLNGSKGPNKGGRDVFAFEYDFVNSVDKSVSKNHGKFEAAGDGINYCGSDKLGGGNNGLWFNISCAKVIMQNNWQIKDDYPW